MTTEQTAEQTIGNDASRFLDSQPHLAKNAGPAADALDALDLRVDQDWAHEATTWTFADGSKIRISGPFVDVLDAWAVGDVYFQAHGELSGRPWDLGTLGEYCRDKAEAEQNAEIWLGDLSGRDRENAVAYVTRYRVLDLEDDGSIGSAVSF